MLRITTHDENEFLTLQVEGRLAGPWVDVLRDCWNSASAKGRTVRVDLRSVTFVDAAGKTLLADLSRHNAQLVAGDCQMCAILAELRHSH